MKYPFPLRHSIPGTLLLLGSILIGVSFYDDVRSTESLIELHSLRRAKSLGNHVSSKLEFDYMHSDVQATALEFSLVNTEPDLRTSLVCDESNRVLYASDYSWRGRTLAGTVPPAASSLVARARETMAAAFLWSRDRRTLAAAFPFYLGLLPGEMRPSRVAALYLEFDVAEPKAANFTVIVRRAWLMGAVVMLLCLLAWWHLTRSLTNRVGLLVASTRELAAGNLAARAQLRGSDELADLAGSFNLMAAQIQSDGRAMEEANMALQDSEERFRQMAENINEVFWMTNPARNQILYLSTAYERIWGRTRASAYESPSEWADAIHSEDRDRVLQAAITRQASGEYDETYRITRPDGSVRWIHDRAFPVRNAAGEVFRIVGTAEDITTQRELEERARESQKLESIGHLAGGVAHDFNNILAAMMMQTELAANARNAPAEVRGALAKIKASTERAANLTRQLLLFSRRHLVQSQRLDLNEIVTNLAGMLERIVGEDVLLQLSLDPAPLITHADAGMLDQVLMNLVVNARDAMPAGGRLTIATSEVTLDAEQARRISDAVPGRYLCLSVGDTGCGIPSDTLSRIWEPFFTTKERGKSTGLGLAAVFGIVKLHHGWLEVDSEVGQGTTIRIFLPASDAPSEPTTEQAAKPDPRGGTETILLVEDEPAIRMVMREVLEVEGYLVLEAADGVEAKRVWHEHEDGIDLLLTDLVMPKGIHGLELAEHLRGQKPGLKVVFMSGYSIEIAGRELPLRDGQAFLQKPFAASLLVDTVRKCLDG